jgi:hypothetical protein
LVTAAEDVIVLREGLLADTAHARALIEQGVGVFVLPVEAGLAAGFERIDINNAAAGMQRIPGRLIEPIAQMSPDCDVPSTLTRIALQAGVALRDVPPEARAPTRWQMIVNEEQAHAIEHEWIAQRLEPAPLASPGRWLARFGVQTFGPSLLHAGNASLMMIAATLAGLLLATGAGWLGAPAVGFAICALAWVFLRASNLLARLEVPLASASDASAQPWHAVALDWTFDAVLVLLLHWTMPPIAGTSLWLALALPLTFVLLARVAGQLPLMSVSATVADRTVLALVLALLIAIGLVDWFVAAATIVLAAMILAATRRRGG